MLYCRQGFKVTYKLFKCPFKSIIQNGRFDLIKWKWKCLIIFVNILSFFIPKCTEYSFVKMRNYFIGILICFDKPITNNGNNPIGFNSSFYLVIKFLKLNQCIACATVIKSKVFSGNEVFSAHSTL